MYEWQKLAIVKWVDSGGRNSWMSMDEAERENVCQCESVGWIVSDNEERIVIVQSRDHSNGTVHSTMTIPKVAVKSVQYLRKK